MTSATWVVELADQELAAGVAELRRWLGAAGFRDLGEARGATELRAADVVVVWADRPLDSTLTAALSDPALRVVLAGSTLLSAPGDDEDETLSDAAGLTLGALTPAHDVRVRAGAQAPRSLHPVAHVHAHDDHSGPHEHVHEPVPRVDKVLDDVIVLRTARVGMTEHPVLTWRPATATAAWTLGSSPATLADRDARRMLVGLLRLVCELPEPAQVRVGLLGYGAIGHEHSRAVRAVEGLELAAVCDSSEERLAVARVAAPAVATTTSATELIDSADVDLVIVSTPPNTHAEWALRAIDSGKHVVVEKPFAIHTHEADEVLAAAASKSLLAAVYQNRRYDPDHLAVRRLVQRGAIGDVFHIETFIGGYGHPCNLWHSDEAVSGGSFYDWGSHVFDQILDLVPTEVEHVTASTHKLRWFDVTNADHSRTTIRFADGTEAEFVHSDLAAALKPRWYVLGTDGAIVGHWRTEKSVSRSDIGTLVEDVLAPTDSPPRLELHAVDGSITHVATPPGAPYGFHREVADRVRFGLPMTITGAQSRRVLAVMEAARISAATGGKPVAPR